MRGAAKLLEKDRRTFSRRNIWDLQMTKASKKANSFCMERSRKIGLGL